MKRFPDQVPEVAAIGFCPPVILLRPSLNKRGTVRDVQHFITMK
ncbi:MAG TPA: hypothetical protein VGD17_14740 [Chitinophagaceae bacterium]